jgi:hypothetical protein
MSLKTNFIIEKRAKIRLQIYKSPIVIMNGTQILFLKCGNIATYNSELISTL